MEDCFQAIAVGQGDAFFFRRNGFSALVDGGRAQKTFHKKFTSTTGQKHADVVVCTHNDADHSKGIAGFLQNDLTCGEVWLPHIWTARLNDLIGKPDQFLQELANDVANQQTVDQKGSSSLQKIGNYQAKKRFIEVHNSMEERPKKLHSKDSSPNLLMPGSKNIYKEWRGKKTLISTSIKFGFLAEWPAGGPNSTGTYFSKPFLQLTTYGPLSFPAKRRAFRFGGSNIMDSVPVEESLVNWNR